MALMTEIYLDSKLAARYLNAVDPIPAQRINEETASPRTKIVLRAKEIEYDPFGLRFPRFPLAI